ncbi:unnamed protein product [Cladocopium goreaui]|uniref:50S ribosomal protein L9, chloroplastic n=1 Tax=Cladocopium goreaui TaxID=2562237 RepID=A0A9P1CZ54_9DINO|nr:unnamed protein product [Cladocopium goreaui]
MREAVPMRTWVLPRQRSRFATLAALLCAVAALATQWTAADETLSPTFAYKGGTAVAPRRKKARVILLKDYGSLGKKDDIVDVKRGYYRNYLFPEGIAIRESYSELNKIKLEQKRQAEADAQLVAKATEQKAKIESHGEFVFEKKVREGSDSIYGSLSEINVAEEVVKSTAIPIKRTSVTIPKVTALGEYKGTIDLGAGITASIDIKVVKEGGDGDGEAEEE